MTPDRPLKRMLRPTNQVGNKKVFNNNQGSRITYESNNDNLDCDTANKDDQGYTKTLLTEYCNKIGWDPKALLTYAESDCLKTGSIVRATTFKQIAQTLKSACLQDGKVSMDIWDLNKFRNSPLVAAFLLVNFVRLVFSSLYLYLSFFSQELTSKNPNQTLRPHPHTLQNIVLLLSRNQN